MPEQPCTPLPQADPAARGDLHALFRPDEPNHPGLFAALEGRAPGRVVVDRAESPTQALLHIDYGFTYASRDISPEFLGQALEQLHEQVAAVVLIWDPTRSFAPPGAPSRCTERREYTERASSLALGPLPNGLAFEPMDARLLERCLWKGEVESAFGSSERFFRQGGGWCVVGQGDILSEAYAFLRGGRTVEIGVITAPAARGQGLGVHSGAQVIAACESRELRTYWSCHVSNRASIRLAEKLGFVGSRDYTFLRY